MRLPPERCQQFEQRWAAAGDGCDVQAFEGLNRLVHHLVIGLRSPHRRRAGGSLQQGTEGVHPWRLRIVSRCLGHRRTDPGRRRTATVGGIGVQVHIDDRRSWFLIASTRRAQEQERRHRAVSPHFLTAMRVPDTVPLSVKRTLPSGSKMSTSNVPLHSSPPGSS